MPETETLIPNCRFCAEDPSLQTIKGAHVYGGTPEQHFYRCAACDSIYLYPPLNAAEETRFYKEEFENYMSERSGQDMDWTGPEKHFQSNQREVSRRLPFLQPYLKHKSHTLEIGCSSGFMLSALQKEGMDVCGLDPSGGFIDYVRAKGIKVFSDLQELKKNHKPSFDLIIHYYVLEHISDPVEFLNEYLKLLKPGGVMVFEVPCVSDPLIELYHVGPFEKFYWSVAHHWYFNKTSMAQILKKAQCTFELFPEQRYDLSNHVVWMNEGKSGGLGRYKDVFGEELDRLYKAQLKKNWLCDTIVAVLKPEV